jgi:diguanylate cyclase (GGDEF)-like protein/PAS domain S-box-containing protein
MVKRTGQRAKTTLFLLVLEESKNITPLCVRILRKAGHAVKYRRIINIDLLKTTLAKHKFDVIISDHRLPHPDAFKALAVLKDTGLDASFVVMSASINDATGARLTAAGADDYVIRDNPAQLVSVIERIISKDDKQPLLTLEVERLRNVVSRQENLLYSIPDIVVEVDENKIYRWANKAAIQFFGDDLLGKEAGYYFAGEQDTYSAVQPLLAGDAEIINLESWQRRQDGELRLLSWQCRTLRDKDGNIKGALSSAQDITEKKQMEQALSDEATRRRILVEQSRDGIVILDQDGKVYESNRQFSRMLGYSPEEASQLCVFDWEYQYPKQQVLEMIRSVDEEGDHFETQHRRKDGTTYDVEISTNAANIGGQKLIFCVCRDITERKAMERRLMVLATQDTLTSLPNRKSFYDRFALSMEQAQRTRHKIALMLLDLDRFKFINDNFGHETGDLVLSSAAARLNGVLRRVDMVARYGGDEFVIMIWGITSKDDEAKVAYKILEVFRQPMIVNDNNLMTTVSIGVSSFPEDGRDLATLMKKADQAMYRAKDDGGDNFKLADSEDILVSDSSAFVN